MKKLITNYVFIPATRQLVLSDYTSLDLDGLLLITNVTDNIVIYNFASIANHAVITGNVITLSYDTTTMEASDNLQIFYDDGVDEQKITVTTMLKALWLAVCNLDFVDKTLNRVRSTTVVESGTIGTITNAVPVGNIATVDTYQGKTLIIDASIMAWAAAVRNTIS